MKHIKTEPAQPIAGQPFRVIIEKTFNKPGPAKISLVTTDCDQMTIPLDIKMPKEEGQLAASRQQG